MPEAYGGDLKYEADAYCLAFWAGLDEARRNALSEADRALSLDLDYLDAQIAKPPPKETPYFLLDTVGIRTIGRQLYNAGGLRLMRAVADQAVGLAVHPDTRRVLDERWQGIGDWPG